VAHDLCTVLAPVLSFTMSEAWDHLPGRPAESVFLAGMPRRERPADAEALEARYAALFEVRKAVQEKLERAREQKLIGKSLEAAVTVAAEGAQRQLLEGARAELATLFIVSGVTLRDGPLAVEVAVAPGQKCARCWVQSEEVGRSAAHPLLCAKCEAAVS